MILSESEDDVTFFRMARGVLGRGLFWTGCYLVDGLLIDSGPPALAEAFVRVLEGRAIVAVALTHHHEDHIGGAPALYRRRGLVPLIHREALGQLRSGYGVPLYRRLTWGRPEGVAGEALGDEVRSLSRRFRVVHTPGHSADHVCLFDEDRGFVFTGDLFLAERLRYLRSDEDLSALVASLQAVAALEPRAVFCAHRGRIRDGPAALVRKARGLVALRERILDLMDSGLPDREIARRAVGPEGALTWISSGEFSAVNFVRAVAGGRGGAPRP